jgi:hypothetical protein
VKKDSGAPASRTGSHASHEAATASSPAGFDPSRGCGTCGSHKLTAEQFEALWQSAEIKKAKRAADMPTEQDAINLMWSAYQRLKELGWNDPIYCPKDGSLFDVIEAGSTGIFKAHYEGEWPDGSWWAQDADDVWPSRPTLYRITDAEKARWEAAAPKLRALMRELRDNDGVPKDRDTPSNPLDCTSQAEAEARGLA